MRHLVRAALLAAVAFAAACPAIADDNLRSSAQSLATGTSNNALVFDLLKNETVLAANVTGLTASGATLAIEGSSDSRADSDSAKTWFAIYAVPFTCPSPPAFSTLSADQPFKIDVTGLTNVRFRVSSTGTGNATLGINAVPAAAMAVCGGGGFQDSAFSGSVPMTVGTTYAAQRSVGVLATVAGNVTFTLADASTITLPVYAGLWQVCPFAVTSIASSGTTATATYFNLK